MKTVFKSANRKASLILLAALFGFYASAKAQEVNAVIAQADSLSEIQETIEIYKQFESLCLSNRYEEALTLIQPYQYRLPKQHAEWTANILENKANEYESSGDYVQAEKYYLEAKEIREKVLGKEHPDYAASLNHLG
ncbi:MAG: tetratricopeptide repeat protein, partial [Bacteroidales bacterium]|nr:tetratricopeptide repeat protein [Bacteroidales bacterium]